MATQRKITCDQVSEFLDATFGDGNLENWDSDFVEEFRDNAKELRIDPIVMDQFNDFLYDVGEKNAAKLINLISYLAVTGNDCTCDKE